jgi:cytochrome P450
MLQATVSFAHPPISRRGCIGYRFALLEYKTILATLINAYEFEERDIGGTEFVGEDMARVGAD